MWSATKLGIRLGDWIWSTLRGGENLQLAYLLPWPVCQKLNILLTLKKKYVVNN